MELADELKAKALPIPTEQRVDVYVVTPCADIEAYWRLAGGISTFHSFPLPATEAAQFCGVALFTLDNPHRVPGYVYQALQPFFERAGREANVFEFCPVRRHFTRRDEDYLLARIL